MRHFALFSLIFLLATSCGNNTNENQKLNLKEDTSRTEKTAGTSENMKRIVFFGNSLTAAYGLEKKDGFPALIQQKIDSLNLPYQCVNSGVSGETTSGGLERVDWILKQPVSIFVLELGANDGLRGIQTEETEKNLRLIFDKVIAKYPEVELVLAGMYVPPNMGPEYSDRFKSIYPDVAKDYDAALIPFLLEDVATADSLLLEDKLHPNVKGQRIVAKNVWSYIYPLLKK